ncbi:MAG: UDP-N-acetylmuramoyl-tripeptide--D-alanyl-D-alanine ligase, partial [Tepidisphaeraceae bacterium]
MNPISLAEIRRVTGAVDVSADVADMEIAAVCTDTRKMAARSLFIALRGDHFDAHDFLDQAHAGGAAAALVDHAPANPPAGLRLLRVPNTRAAMGILARRVRQQFRGQVIAVAGSNGKTGTKHLIHSALRETVRGSMSPKSFNNDIGVPLAIFPADPTDDYLILELGTNHPGEIRNLTHIALPDIAIITNCSAEHLEGLGTLDGVRRENASLIDGLQSDGTLIINGDDPALIEAACGFHGDCLTFGFSQTNDVWASNAICSWNGTHFTIQPGGIEAFVPLLGNHVAANALAAVAVARRLGL